jgi:hypothetical protein
VTEFNYFIPIGIGGLFTIVGLVMVVWGRRGEKKYSESLSSRTDMKEFLEQWPKHFGYDSVKLGGLIFIAVGVVLLALALVFSRLS